MNTSTITFPFARLSTELALEILQLAATPDFATSDGNPYSSALTLCLVSHAVRRTALPQLLHTVLLSHAHNVLAFIHALRLQKSYKSHALPLAVDYTLYIRRLWVGECWDIPPLPPAADSSASDFNVPDIDYALLAPVLLAAPEFGVDFACLHVLYKSLEVAWTTSCCFESDSPLLPWKTHTLTLAGDFWRWRPLTSTAEGSAFLGSISQLVLLIPTHFGLPGPFRRETCSLPVPWASLPRVERVVFPSPDLLARYEDVRAVDVEMQTIEGPGLAAKDAGTPRRERVRVKMAEGEGKGGECSVDWEDAWACALVG
ncbi:hypothetical protein BV22DRAFT_1039663 [Leucogyrophana mollusca]|uniref:Uncharacterized protein n=1 Tax=Leucogyrophana mollusca TaxID=85980 RepID=A0ACB8B5W2_9AGAM|nr:hypothetical protein BV22DRAFT_1039663 [Leucogyrophana mollusca]